MMTAMSRPQQSMIKELIPRPLNSNSGKRTGHKQHSQRSKGQRTPTRRRPQQRPNPLRHIGTGSRRQQSIRPSIMPQQRSPSDRASHQMTIPKNRRSILIGPPLDGMPDSSRGRPQQRIDSGRKISGQRPPHMPMRHPIVGWRCRQ